MMLGDYANFARPRGAKDKKPRKRRGVGTAISAVGSGAGVGAAVGGIRARGGIGINDGRAKTMLIRAKKMEPRGRLRAAKDLEWQGTMFQNLSRKGVKDAHDSRVAKRTLKAIDRTTAARIRGGAGKGALIGAAAGAGAYGAYRGIKALRRKKNG